MKSGKIPMRSCVGCGESKPKSSLIRIVKTPEGEINIDRTGKKNGRGAYICEREECLIAAQKKRSLERAFSCAVPPEVYESLGRELHGNGE